MAQRLAGKASIITGTGGAIGRATALAFAREGALVVGCDIAAGTAQETVELVRKAGYEMTSLAPCDLTDPKQCRALVAHTVERHGRVDVLVNNAGRVHMAWIEEMSHQQWHETMEGELSQVFTTTQAAWPELSKRGGAIVNLASTAGWISYKVLGGVAHCAAKGGVIAMTRQLAMEGRRVAIRANSISPGVIETPRTSVLLTDPAWGGPMLGKIMRGTAGKPEEIANVAVFLASDESSFVNAADIIADGGATAW